MYRARDTRLDRDVAIKILPETFAHDPERVARFQREAKTLAALNHPNIGGIYGLEEAPGVAALVLEIVEGPTLAERIARGPVPLDEALPIARQICEALEAAHEQGIIHRDLKPANIKITPGGVVKVLDFALAKLSGPPEVGRVLSDPPQLTLSPTITSPAMMTGTGMLLGTPAYMAPEQAKGRLADKRSDIWAFGCVLFEMLTGKRPFEGEDLSDTMAAVLRGEPDWKALPPDLPAAIRTLLRRCVEKDPKRRLHDAADVRILLEEAGSAADVTPVRVRRLRPVLIAASLALVAGAAIATAIVWRMTPVAPSLLQRFELAAPAPNEFAGTVGVNIAVSRDGSQIVYTGRSGDTTQLVLRRGNQSQGVPIAGTEQGLQPFFSPDGRQIGFNALDGSVLKTIAVPGGATTTVCRLAGNLLEGASWGDDGTIVFSDAGQLFRVAATGGTPNKFASPDPAKGEREYVWPEVLPGARAMLFTIVPASLSAPMQIAVRVFATGETRMLMINGSSARYVSPGHIVYASDGRLMAAPFDVARAELTGTAAVVLDTVAVRGSGGADFAVSRNGTLVYAPGGDIFLARRPVWRDRTGKSLGTVVQQPVQFARYPRLSPDGHRLAVTVGPGNGGQIWVYDVRNATPPVKLTFEAHNVIPIWMPDGKRIVFQSSRAGSRSLYSMAADGSVLEPEPLIVFVPATGTRPTGTEVTAENWSPDGAWLLFGERDGQSGSHDLWLFRASDRSRTPWLQTRFEEAEASFSPDGRSVAYVSDQTGASEVWVRPFPGPGTPIRISANGGHDPVWSRDGRELFYQTASKLMAVSLTRSGSELNVGVPHVLFEGGFVAYTTATPRTYDVAPDGRFLMLEAEETRSAPLEVVLNWNGELKRLAPVGR